jgi:hypothetical protein
VLEFETLLLLPRNTDIISKELLVDIINIMRRYGGGYKPRSVRRLQKKSTKRLIFSLVLGLVLIYFIISWGLPALIGSLSFLNKFKAQPAKVESIEDSAIAPPVLNIPYEATNTAEINISGYSQSDSKVEIYIDDKLESSVGTLGDGSFRAEGVSLGLGTNNIHGITIIEDEKGEAKKSLPSKNIRVLYSNDKPTLEVSEPSDGMEVKGGDKKVKVSGKTDPENSVSINGITAILSSEGNFSKEVSINDGENTISIESVNDVGNKTTEQRKVIYTP